MEIYFVFFLPPPQKRRKKPHTHCSTFASPTSQRSKPKLAKELQFCLRTSAAVDRVELIKKD